jgi:hypothetical protein
VLEFLLALALAFYMVFFGVREINRDKVSQSTYINVYDQLLRNAR